MSVVVTQQCNITDHLVVNQEDSSMVEIELTEHNPCDINDRPGGWGFFASWYRSDLLRVDLIFVCANKGKAVRA